MELKIINETSRKKDTLQEESIVCNPTDKVSDLKRIVMSAARIKLDESRVGLYFIDSLNGDKKTFLSSNKKTLRDYGVNDKVKILVKDLGPQINWRFTYIFEYLGPFFLTIFFFLYLGPANSNTTQKLGFMMSTFHFGKRILESIFVHEFSNSTMPLKNLFINVTYYWIIYGVICSYFLFNVDYKEPTYNTFIRYFFVFLFFSAEIKNLKCHLILKGLKEKNQGEKGIPYGEGFEYVSCANYFWEFLAWSFFSLFVNLASFYVFTLFGFLIMRAWAIKKHKEYLKTFADRYPKNRKAIIPFLI
jgi:very-long-chain enoyl-CoA reductase